MGWSKPLDEKESFLRREILSSTINGAFQHAGVYEEKPDRLRKSEWEEQKKDFRKKIGKYLDEVVEEYNPDKNHYERIRMFVKTIKDPLLKKDKNNEVSFGVAQKLVNLYLKYLWCLAKFNDIPPHCPIDAGILKKKNGDAEEFGPWTKMDEEKYRGAIEKIKRTRSVNLAVWELEVWNKEN